VGIAAVRNTEGRMSGDIQARLYGWIDRAAASATGREPLSQLVLSHINASDQLQEVARFAVANTAAIGEIKTELFRTAAEIVTSWRHFQRFAVQAFYGDGDKAGAYYPFALADDTPINGPEATEPANAVGMLRQQMRHNEILAKINAGISAEQSELLLRMNQQLTAELERVRESHSKLLAQTEGQILERQRLELEQSQQIRAEVRKDQLTGSVVKTVPYIANRISEHFGGPKLLPETGMNPLEGLLASMFGTLTDDTFSKLLSIFPDPAHQQGILELYSRLVRAPSAPTAAKQ
jgi:hypothetical protein